MPATFHETLFLYCSPFYCQSLAISRYSVCTGWMNQWIHVQTPISHTPKWHSSPLQPQWSTNSFPELKTPLIDAIHLSEGITDSQNSVGIDSKLSTVNNVTYWNKSLGFIFVNTIINDGDLTSEVSWNILWLFKCLEIFLIFSKTFLGFSRWIWLLSIKE